MLKIQINAFSLAFFYLALLQLCIYRKTVVPGKVISLFSGCLRSFWKQHCKHQNNQMDLGVHLTIDKFNLCFSAPEKKQPPLTCASESKNTI